MIKIKHGDYIHALKKSKKLFYVADKTSNIYIKSRQISATDKKTFFEPGSQWIFE